MRYLSENGKSVGKILLVMLAVTAVLLLLLAFLAQRLNLTEGGIMVGICVVYVLSCFVGGFFAGKVQRSKKFIWGMLMGLLYVTIILAVTAVVKKGVLSEPLELLLNVLLCVGGGMLGGMLS